MLVETKSQEILASVALILINISMIISIEFIEV